MSFYEKGPVRIHYQEAGSGFPLLLIAGGGLNSTIGGLGGMLAKGRSLSFLALISSMTARGEIIATFLAVLELMRQRRLIALQRFISQPLQLDRGRQALSPLCRRFCRRHRNRSCHP